MKINILSRLAWLLAFAISAPAFAATLKIGDPAPKLQTGKWVQGDPVTAFEKDKAYIVEFWATWCGPCKVSIPHLNEIHEKYKDKGLVVIGQDVWERDEKLVAPFVKEMGEKMTYRVALDDKADGGKGKMAETWMTAADQNGIPAAFLVDKQGKIAWIGHPMTLKEHVIEQVLAGKYDVKAAAAEYNERQSKQEEMMKLSRKFSEHMQAKEWDKAEATLDEIGKTMPEDERSRLEPARLRIMLTKGDYEAAAKTALKVSDQQKDNAAFQNQLAWSMATTKGLSGEALKAAATIANRANGAAGGKDAAILDTVARITFMQGDTKKAVALQEKAVAMADGDMKSQLQETLDSYKAGKLPNEE